MATVTSDNVGWLWTEENTFRTVENSMSTNSLVSIIKFECHYGQYRKLISRERFYLVTYSLDCVNKN